MSSHQETRGLRADDDASSDVDDSNLAWDCELEKRRDEAVVRIMYCLDESVKAAKELNLLFVAAVLTQARETIIHWTAQAGFENTRKAPVQKPELMAITCRILASLLASDL